MRRERMGGLETRIVGEGDGPVVVLLHGFGAPAEDLVPLARVLRAPPGTRFVFPAAPIAFSMGFGESPAPGDADVPPFGRGVPAQSRAWWMIDMERLARGGPAVDRAREVPEGLAVAREMMLALLADVERVLAPPRVVLGGFSQGAMLSLDVALHTERALAGLVLMSGTLLAEQVWTPRMPARRGLPVLMSHGAYDPLLAPEAAERLRELLVAAGLLVDWVVFPGEHEIPGVVLEALSAFLRRVLP